MNKIIVILVMIIFTGCSQKQDILVTKKVYPDISKNAVFDAANTLFILSTKENANKSFIVNAYRDKLEVNKIMAELKIDNLYGRETSQLSGGELQKVFIAKILVQDTPVILFDEPFNNLDITFQKELIKLLKKLKMQGKTIIIAMHELNIAINECDNIVLLEKGVINYCGTSNEFVNQVISKAIDSELVNIELFQYDNKWYIK